jgi:hypothetical protein
MGVVATKKLDKIIERKKEYENLLYLQCRKRFLSGHGNGKGLGGCPFSMVATERRIFRLYLRLRVSVVDT